MNSYQNISAKQNLHEVALVGFARLLGFTNVVSKNIRYLTSKRKHVAKTKSSRLSSREDELVTFVRDSNPGTPTYFIDQKATTICISRFVQTYGYAMMAIILREGFGRLDSAKAEEYKASLEDIQRWVDNNVSRMKKSVEKSAEEKKGAKEKSILIFNHRVADGAKPEQDIERKREQNKIYEILNARKEEIVTWTFLADSKNNAQPLSNNFISLFEHPPKKEDHDKWDNAGLYKIRQIKLLLACSNSLPSIMAAGNTSGTLDIFAFLGINTYCFHKFNLKNHLVPILCSSDYRIVLQSLFMSIGHRLNMVQIVENEKRSKNFISWLDSKGEKMFLCKVPHIPIGSPGRERDNKYVEYNDRLPFAGAITWRDNDEKRTLPEREISNKVGGYLITFGWFREVDRLVGNKWEQKEEENNVNSVDFLNQWKQIINT